MPTVLPFVASYHITPATALDAIEVYRAEFTAVDGVVRAVRGGLGRHRGRRRHRHRQHLASSYGHWVHSIRAGDGAIPYPDPDTVDR